MTQQAEQMKPALSALPVEDRAELARFLIASLDPVVDEDAEAAWDAELDRRAREIETGQAIGERAESVFAELRKKYS